MRGNRRKPKGVAIEADPNTNVLYPNGSRPAVGYRVEKREKVTVETVVRTFVR